MQVFFHDKCFDGACSASLFTRFHQECSGGGEKYVYRGLVHKAGGLIDEGIFGDGGNAIVDFKYSSSPKLTWWFDHHLSAFAGAEEREHFDRVGAPGGQQFYDPDYTSCTTFIAHIAKTRFGFDTAGLEELLHWADIVDGAKYESAKAAVELEAPAMKLTLVIENAPASDRDDALIPRMIPLLTSLPLQEVLNQPFVQEFVGPLLDQHWEALELIRQRARVERGVITFDLIDQRMEAYSKFIPYYLHPEATYVVGVSKSSFRTKISVGTNPWTQRPAAELANIAEICERFGGGGHARVGAISFGLDQEDEVRRVAGVVAAELKARE
ncbi:phosphoesterase [Granulicella sp. WH15]|uniref:phosphoesterase n=1 Tax=Granulicella sp. WH15 TaxID=2602070 RepID=UPI0013674E03|nr:phosphoesterase [Granulicella sp. WH15]QHN04435.1 phosphoesterase [Granulicella sp. WH15]